MSRVLSWFSCGDASAVAAKLTVEKYGDRCEVLYCDTFAYEHPDNRRFFADVERWLGREIKVLRSDDYRDIYGVFERTRWLVGVGGAAAICKKEGVTDGKRWRKRVFLDELPPDAGRYEPEADIGSRY